MSDVSCPLEEIRMILIGRSGSGKSSLGNTILGKRQFRAGKSPIGITKQCSYCSQQVRDKRLFVVDTPGFFDPTIHEEKIQDEIGKAYQSTAQPGPHAFLLVINPDTFTEEQAQAVENFKKIFQPNPFSHTIIIFTHGDSFDPEETTIENYLAELPIGSALRTTFDQCQQRYLLVNNKASETEKDEITMKLLDMVTKMIKENKGQVYRTDQFDAAAKIVAEEGLRCREDQSNSSNPITLHPKIKEIIVEGHLRVIIGRS